MSSQPGLSGDAKGDLWFEGGIWRYRCPATGRAREISGLIRELAYDAAALAQALGVGERSFRRMVKDSLGVPPGVWLRQQRAIAAAHRLREGCPVKQLAAEYGFRHPGDFSVEFRRWFGMSPAEFVRKGTIPEDVMDDGFWPKNLSD